MKLVTILKEIKILKQSLPENNEELLEFLNNFPKKDVVEFFLVKLETNNDPAWNYVRNEWIREPFELEKGLWVSLGNEDRIVLSLSDEVFRLADFIADKEDLRVMNFLGVKIHFIFI